ncbi:outer membrane autotransporter barrel domain-containing protein 8 [Pandoraea sputorum]|nr:outer membrane autotransporter barrel domain-containing protein 8 [Pandoraea sputorum]
MGHPTDIDRQFFVLLISGDGIPCRTGGMLLRNSAYPAKLRESAPYLHAGYTACRSGNTAWYFGGSVRDKSAALTAPLRLKALCGVASVVLAGHASAQSSGPYVLNYRGATGGCCTSSNGYNGENGRQDVTQTVTGLNIQTTGGATGVLVDVSGGNGGNGNPHDDDDGRDHWGGNGGIGRIIDFTLAQSTVMSTGIGVSVLSAGGDGGLWGNRSDGHGIGGDGHLAALTLIGGSVNAFGYGLSAQSVGGNGKDSAIPSSGGLTPGLNAGYGGNAGDANITVKGGAVITVSGTGGAAIRAESLGGQGGLGVDDDIAGYVDSGWGGNAGNVNVTIADGTITAHGNGEAGILARAVGGSSPKGAGIDVKGGNGGNAGHVSVQSGAAISTDGVNAPGIAVYSLGGDGGDGGDGNSGSGFPGGDGGTPGGASVTNSGSIATQGLGSTGIRVVVVGGSGGNGGASGPWSGHGGDGGAGGNTGALAVNIVNNGNILTNGRDAIGILTHAVGGGAGNAEISQGLMNIGGGAGGNGGQGGNVYVQNNGAIFTTGDQSPAAVVQSIGGGGGHGGDADTTGIIVGIATGGRGGAGGDGGTATLDQAGAISTAGAGAAGAVVQSIGGGGGVGGSSSAITVGIGLGVAVSHGGSGGQGGTGGTARVSVDDDASITTQGVSSDAVVAQSIGGGGGYGGLASASSITIAPDLGPDLPTGTISPHVSLGGRGGGGGNGGFAQVENDGNIVTQGDRSLGILAQSIGGGGGAGGNAAAPLRAKTVSAPGSRLDVSVGVSIGGAGGSGGAGGVATVTNSVTGIVETSGDHAIGILAQSVGGGGGNGGSVQQETAQSFSATLGSPTSALGTLQTIMQWLETSGQSLNVKFGSLKVGVDVRVGGSGGSGGDGVGASVFNNGQVTTTGDGAAAIVAQSVGGGGGSGGTATSTSASSLMSSIDSLLGVVTGKIGQYFQVSPNTGTNVAVGGSGGSGGNGGPVGVTQTGTIVTKGFASPGIVAQSIGGGGGAGVSTAQNLDVFLSNWAAKDAPGILSDITRIVDLLGSNLASAQHNVNVSVGAKGGGAGYAGLVTVDASSASSQIQTLGDNSPGILAQGIAGGGGLAGASAYTFGPSTFGATAGATQPALALSLGAAYDATISSVSGTSFPVVVKSGGAISTHGDDSSGVLAQNIAGGGGVAVANLTGNASTHLAQGQGATSPALSLGASVTGMAAPALVRSGTVTVTNTATIETTGALSHGIFAQSVSGGGGAAGWVASGGAMALLAGPVMQLGASQSGANSLLGMAGNVTVSLGAPSTIATTGALSFGVLAQSIGGGGGYAASVSDGQPSSLPITSLLLGAQGQTGGAGAQVSVTAEAGSAIQTQGRNAFGIVAQSVGGGGGIAGLTTAPGRVTLASLNNTLTTAGVNDGGTVDVSVAGKVKTTGDGAVGVLAQSVGGGGGIAGDAASVTYGTSVVHLADIAGAVGTGSTVTVNVAGGVATYGANAPAILAMSLGGGAVFSDGGILLKNSGNASGNSGGAVSVAIAPGATVVAMGAGSPAIAAISTGRTGGNASETTQGKPVSVTIGSGATVAANATSGIGVLAITTDGVSIDNAGTLTAATAIESASRASVSNTGRVQGNVQLTSDSTFVNQQSGALYTASRVTTGMLQNYGTLNPGGPGVFQASTVDGAFSQTGTGVYAPDLDFTRHNSDFLVTTGALTFGGSVVPVLHNPVKNIWLGIGHFDRAPTGESATAKSTALVFSYQMKDHYGGTQDPLISVDANFKPQGVALNGNQSSFANHLQWLWDQGLVDAGPLFQPFASVGDAASYRRALNTLSGAASLMRAGSRGQENFDFLNRLMSCPQFVSGGTRLSEGSCVWARVIGTRADRYDTADDVGFRSQQVTYQFGVQKEIAPDWFLGGSASYVVTHARSSDQSLDVSSDGFRAGVTLKRQMGPWQVALALLGGYESGTQNRIIDYPEATARASSQPNAFFVGARSRLSYQLNLSGWYVKPYADLDVVYDRSGAYRETGAGVFDLAVPGQGHTTAILSPSVEVGGRFDLRGATLRPYLSLGMSFASARRLSTDVSFVQFPGASFAVSASQPRAYGNFSAGIELLSDKGLEVRAEYSLRTAPSQTVQSAALRLAKHF